MMRTEIRRYQQTSRIGNGEKHKKAREARILEYAPLVKFIAERIAKRLPPNILKEELISSGIEGLIDALNNFDESRGIKFQTYASYRIKGSIIDELRKLDWVPKSVRKDKQRIEKAITAVQIKTGREAEDVEIAEEMGIDLDSYYLLIGRAQRGGFFSLDAIGQDESQPGIARLVADAPSPYDEVRKNELKKNMAKVLSSLSEKERLVISLYYYDELTLKEIAEVMSLTESRISQIHSKALARLRMKLKSYQE
jgi:RNA polymerase sigma factor for flagellar operon FliA